MKSISKAFFMVAVLMMWGVYARASAGDHEFTVEKDIHFLTAGGVQLKADVYTPVGKGPWPIVVAFHGGGFVRGDKEDISGKCRRIASGGYVVLNANYRTMSMGFTFPEFIKDAHTAVKWIKKHAAEYGGDPAQVAITGFSAGGYICSLTAVTSHIRQLQHKDEKLAGISSQVQAAVPFYGHHDLTILDEVQAQTARLIWGGSVNEKLLKRASPASYVRRSPPTLLFHNEVDHLVPVQQSRSMYRRLTDAGVPAWYYEFPETAHDLLRPDEDWALGVTVDFLGMFLKGNKHISMPDSVPPRTTTRE